MGLTTFDISALNIPAFVMALYNPPPIQSGERAEDFFEVAHSIAKAYFATLPVHWIWVMKLTELLWERARLVRIKAGLSDFAYAEKKGELDIEGKIDAFEKEELKKSGCLTDMEKLRQSRAPRPKGAKRKGEPALEEEDLDPDEVKSVVLGAAIEFERDLFEALRSERKFSPMAMINDTAEDTEVLEERLRALDLAVRIHIKSADFYGLVATSAVQGGDMHSLPEPTAE